MLKLNGSSKTSSSKFAEPYMIAARSPFFMVTPPISTSSVAVRWNEEIGEAHRRISSYVVSGRSFLNSSHCSGLSRNAIIPWVVALRVVSLPATARRTTNQPNSSAVSFSPSTSAWTSLVTRSSRGSTSRLAASSIAYPRISAFAALDSSASSGMS